jgi:hypothetical protein
MKNLYFLAAIAAFALGSCTVEEALDPPAGPDDEANAIGFGTFLDRAPQNGIKPLAAIVGIKELKGRGFMVQAYTTVGMSWNSWTEDKTTPNFMRNQPVTWAAASTSTLDPGTWTYSPIRYWPRRSTSVWDYVHLFAYTPAQNTSSTVTFAGVADGNPQLHYTMSANPRNQTDLIVAAKYNARGNENGGKVTFNFDHVLSRIGFKVKLKNAYEGVTIKLSRVSVSYISMRNTGTYTFNSGTGSGSTGQDNKAENIWETGGTLTDGFYLFDDEVTLTDDDAFDISDQNGSANYLMLIPQTISDSQMRMGVNFTIYYPPGSDPESQPYNMSAYLKGITWEPGRAYTYMLNVAPTALEIDVEETKWNGWEDVVPPIDPIDVP